MRLKDKVAIVTGGNKGIGASICARFAAEGAHVAVMYRDHGSNAADVTAQVKGFATKGLAVEGDISKRADVERVIRQTVAEFGRLDIAVSNAGMEIKKDFVDVTDDEWNQVLEVNLNGAFYLAQIAARQMIEQNKTVAAGAGGSDAGKGGRLLFVSSCHEDIPFPGYTAYCASKGATRMMMRNLCIELAPHKITANNIAPGAIATSINKAVLDDPEAMKNALSEIPWGRFGRPEEVASLTTFLAGDEAEYVTGSTYYIDGGLTQQVTQY